MKRAIVAFGVLILLSACRGEEMKTEEIQYGMPPPGGVVDPAHGKEAWFAIGALEGTGENAANGVAQAHSFADGHFLHTVQLNVAIAPEGYFYEGWLLRGDDARSTGHLTNRWGDTRHQLRFEADQDYREYLKVVITLERDDGNPAPALHVAEGVMHVTERP